MPGYKWAGENVAGYFYPAVRSELMFLLYKNPDIPRRGNPELAPVGRVFKNQ